MKLSSCIKSFMLIEAINKYKLKLISLFAYLLDFEPSIGFLGAL